MKRWVVVVVFVFSASMSNGPSACIVRHTTFDEAMDSSDAVILGQIMRIGAEQQDRFGRSREYDVRVLDVLVGDLKAGDSIEVDLVRHHAGRYADGTVDCPLVRGSGREDDFRSGERYLLLLKREGRRFDLYWSNRWRGSGAMAAGGEGKVVARFPEPTKTIESTTDARLTYIVENQATENVTVNSDLLGSAIFALDVLADGERMLTIPPSVPRIDHEPALITLAPGQKRMFTLSLNVFSPPLPAGSYDVPIANPVVSTASETLTLIVSPGN